MSRRADRTGAASVRRESGGSEVHEGRISRIIYHEGPEYGVFVLSGDEGSEITVAAKNCGTLLKGSPVRVQGKWEDTRYGMQLVADFVASKTSPSVLVAAAFLKEEVNGIGEVRSGWLIEKFGERLPDVLGNPAELVQAAGIGPVLAKEIADRWSNKTPADLANLELASHGITAGARKALLAKFGSRAALVIRENPWEACKARGIGFKGADQLAQKLGASMSHPGRAEAAVLEAVAQAVSEEGSTRVSELKIYAFAAEVSVSRDALAVALAGQLAEGNLIVPEKGYLALRFHDAMERVVALTIRKLSAVEIGGEPVVPVLDGLELVKDQKAAVEGLQRRAFGLMVGGPGTGKTTTCRGLVAAYEQRWPDLPILLCAPTGRAAKKLSQSVGRDACTIHRLLGFARGDWHFNAGNKLPQALILVDEVSMVDVVLAYRLLSAVRDGSTVLFVGDADQLPSVGPGAVLRDVILGAPNGVPLYRLTQIMRQAAGNPVIAQSHAINAGRFPEGSRTDRGSVVIATKRRGTFVSTPEDVGDGVMAAIEWIVGMGKTSRDVQVLAFGHRTAGGTLEMNKRLTRYWLPDSDEDVRLPVGCLVLQTKNDYRAGVMNGTQGVVEDVNVSERGDKRTLSGVLIRWDDVKEPLWHGTAPEDVSCGWTVTERKAKTFPLGGIFPAWAMSVHKAQGSEWPWVVVAIHAGMGFPLLRREVLYTAFTRAREGVIVVGPQDAIRLAVSRLAGNNRRTGLERFMFEDLAEIGLDADGVALDFDLDVG